MQFQFLDLYSPMDDLPGYLCREVGCAAGWPVGLMQSLKRPLYSKPVLGGLYPFVRLPIQQNL